MTRFFNQEQRINIMWRLAGTDESYSGRQCYKYVESLIQDAKELLVVSPYIDSYYARFLIENTKGKRVRVISSSMDPEAGRILRGKRPLGMLLSSLAIILSLDYLAYANGAISAYILMPSALLAVTAFVLFGRHPNGIDVRIPHSFVHAKMYISDKAAMHGSANLTYSGMHRNVEHIEVTSDRARIARMKKEFDDIWNGE